MPPPPIRRFHRRPPPPSLPAPCVFLAAEPPAFNRSTSHATDPLQRQPAAQRCRSEGLPRGAHLPAIPSIKATGFQSAADDLAKLVAAGRVRPEEPEAHLLPQDLSYLRKPLA